MQLYGLWLPFEANVLCPSALTTCHSGWCQLNPAKTDVLWLVLIWTESTADSNWSDACTGASWCCRSRPWSLIGCWPLSRRKHVISMVTACFAVQWQVLLTCGLHCHMKLYWPYQCTSLMCTGRLAASWTTATQRTLTRQLQSAFNAGVRLVSK